MKTKIVQTIWIAENFHTHEIVCATPFFADLIDILCAEDYLNESVYTTRGKTLKELYGENWLKVIKSFSARKIKNLIDWDVELQVIDVVQVERNFDGFR